jgi:hypothetical protein
VETFAFQGRGGYRGVSHLGSGRYLLIICAAVALAVAYGPVTRAQTFGPSYSLTSLTNGGTILVGDKLFSNFFTAGDPFANNITVTALISDGNFGLQFGGGFAANNNEMDFRIGYMVNVTNSNNLISGADLSFNGVTLGSGSALAEVTEDVDTNMDVNVPYGQMSVFVTPASQVLSTNMPINPPQAYLNLEKDVLVDSFTITAFSTISTINQDYMQIPEPSTIALAAAGLTGLLLLRRREH